MTTALRGTMLTPGVSRNGRLYTPDLIEKAHRRLLERLASGRPVTMLTHHAAGDDSTRIVGRVTSVKLNGQNLDYTARLADTTEAKTIAALLKEEDGQAYLENVSIRGWWVGDVQTVDGCETADDLEIDGLDFTKMPGVAGATVRLADSAAKETADGRVLVTESVEAHVFTETITEAAKEPYGDVAYADPGYLKDKKKRYPVDTKAHAKAAWSYINQADNAKQYTAAQLKRVKGRIKTALKKFGVTVTAESLTAITLIAPEVHMLTETDITLSDVTEYYNDTTGQAGFSVSAYNGPLTVSVCAYSGIEPADLSGVAMAAMKAACDAVHALDPDDDGDIDTGAISDETDDNQMESAPADATVKEADMADSTEAVEATETAETATESVDETASTDESTEETAEETLDAPITRADLEAAVTAAVTAALAAQNTAPAESAEAGDVTETVTEDTVTEEALRESIRAEVIREAVKNGVITRKGLVETNGAEPAKPLHEMSDEEFRDYQQKVSHVFFAHNPQ